MIKCKKIFLLLSVFFAAEFMWSQSEEVEEISLPDVSTVIQGGAIKVGKSAVSDFSDVLPPENEETSGELLPKLPEASEAGSLNSDSLLTVSPEKSIYVEGLAGGGYPGFITGNFKIYRQTGSSPFKVEFGHESSNGYAGNTLTSGYSDRDTFISAEKVFKLKKMNLSLEGKYESLDNGLQDKYEYISNVTKEILGGNVIWNLDIPNGFGLEVKGDVNWYKRYATVTNSKVSPVEIQDYAENVSVFDFSPELSFSWGAHGFYSKLSAMYSSEADLKNSFEGSASVNRGQLGVFAGWKNDVVHVFASGSAVVGDHIGDNDVIVPFNAGIDFGFNSSISSRKILMNIEGGIDSYHPLVRELEKQYWFTAVPCLCEETSDWFGNVGLNLPIKDRFTLNFDCEFRKTVYGNELITPDYETYSNLESLYGQYIYMVQDNVQFNTDVSFAIRAGCADFSCGWKCFWIDVPACEDASVINFAVSLQNRTSRFGFEAASALAVNSEADHTPVVDFSAFCRLTSAVRLAVSANDVVKLILQEERDYAGEYISRSGTASVLVKFFF